MCHPCGIRTPPCGKGLSTYECRWVLRLDLEGGAQRYWDKPLSRSDLALAPRVSGDVERDQVEPCRSSPLFQNIYWELACHEIARVYALNPHSRSEASIFIVCVDHGAGLGRRRD